MSPRAAVKPFTISTTELGGWDQCETKSYWGSLNGKALENPLLPEALALGNLVHYTMADWGSLYAIYDKGKEDYAEFPGLDLIIRGSLAEPDPVAIFDRHFAAFERELKRRYWEYNGSEMDPFEWEERYQDPVGILGHAMVENYVTEYGSPYPEDCTLLAPEQTIVIPLPKVRQRQRQLAIEGTLDQLLLDAEGRLLIRDFKTFKQKPSEYELAQHDQFMTYDWLVRQQWPEYECLGVVYDGLRKIASQSKAQKARGTDLFYREYLLYSDEKIEHHGSRLPYRALDAYTKVMSRRRGNILALKTVRSWSTCPGCMYQEPCIALLEGEYGPWDDEAEADAFEGYYTRVKTPAWRDNVPRATIEELIA